MVKKRHLLLFTVLLFSLNSFSQQKVTDIITNNMKEILLEQKSKSKPYYSKVEVEKYIRTQLSDGTWGDIDYLGKKLNGWEPGEHAQRILDLAIVYQTKTSKYYQKASLSRVIHRAIHFWSNAGLKCPNWWYNQIGVPELFGNACLLMKQELTLDEKKQASIVLSVAKFGMTGQNKVWLAGNVMKNALLNDDLETVIAAKEQITSEIKIGTGEGFQPDFSFFQHGNQMQLCNYGLHYSGSMSQFARIFKDTPLAFSNSQKEILNNLFLGCLQWIDWRGYSDINALGRQVFLNRQKLSSESLLAAANNMIHADSSQADKYRKYIYRNHINPTGDNDLIGSNYFWRSDFGVYRTPKWYASVRMHSNRTLGFEMTNKENLQGVFAADGVMQLMLDGNEYYNIFPIWDWKKLPGIKAQDNGKPIEYFYPMKPVNQADFVGGITDNQKAVFAMCLKRDSLTAFKSWFFMDNRIICLGAGIHTSKKYPVFTTLNQTLLDGDIYFGNRNRNVLKLSKEKTITSDSINRVYHDRVGYYLLDSKNLTVSNKTQRGNWTKIAILYTDQPASDKVFKIYISHGIKPSNESYSYVVLPNITRETLDIFAKNPTISVLSNTKKCQAVSNKNESLLQMVFYEPETLKLKNSTLSSLNAGLVIMETLENQQLKITVSDPTQKQSTFNLVLDGEYTSASNTTYDATTNRTNVSISLNTKNGFRGMQSCVILQKK